LTFPPWEGPPLSFNLSSEQEMKLEIPDMSCGGCANAITRAVTGLDPAAKLDIDVAVKIVTVTSMSPPARIIETIEAAGFHPSLKG
jgi:copper chaperone